jgi:hypothetical protein
MVAVSEAGTPIAVGVAGYYEEIYYDEPATTTGVGMVGVASSRPIRGPIYYDEPFYGPNGPYSMSGGELPTDCSPMYLSSGPEYCSMEFECADGYLSTWCDMYDPEQLRCECSSMGGYQSFTLTAMPDDPCASIAEFCMADSDKAVEFTEPEVCTPTYQELGSEWCSMEQQCTQSAEVEEGISVQSNEYQSTWCELYDGSWTCSCNVGGSDLSFDYPESTPAADVCPDALELCTSGAVELGSERECKPTHMSAYGDMCDAQQDCTGSATIDGTEVQVHEWLYTTCYTEVEGEFTCECGMGSKSTTLELSGTDAWTVCEEASVSCVESFTAE